MFSKYYRDILFAHVSASLIAAAHIRFLLRYSRQQKRGGRTVSSLHHVRFQYRPHVADVVTK